MATAVRPLIPEADLPRLSALFRAFEAKAYQQRVQGLDPDRLAQHLTLGVQASSPNHLHWVAEEGNRLVGIAGLLTKHWHADLCSFPVGKVTQFVSLPGAEGALIPLLDTMEKAAHEHRLQHLSARTDSRQFQAQEILTARGWYGAGTSIKMAVSLSERPAAPKTDIAIRPYQPSDRGRVLEIAEQSHDDGHLHFDIRLPNEASHAIFRRWVEMCIEGIAPHVWIAERDGAVIGFVTILDPKGLNSALGTNIAVLDFIVIDREAQGKGIGSQLLGSALARLAESYDQVELRTTATNYPALNLYARHGFKIVTADQVFGRWLG